MRIATLILFGSFMLIGFTPKTVSQTTEPGAEIQPAATASPRSQRDIYILESEADLDLWQAKLLQIDEETDALMRKDGATCWADVLAAMDKAEAGAYKLQIVTAEGLGNARVSYEKAISDLANTWEKARPEDRR